VFIDYSVSAFAYSCTSMLLGLMLVLYRRDIRRQAEIWKYISHLERRADPEHRPPLNST